MSWCGQQALINGRDEWAERCFLEAGAMVDGCCELLPTRSLCELLGHRHWKELTFQDFALGKELTKTRDDEYAPPVLSVPTQWPLFSASSRCP